MSDTPQPPWLSDPAQGGEEPSGREPGFILCGLMAVCGWTAVVMIAYTVASFTSFQPAFNGLVLLAVGAAIYMSVRSPRFSRCFWKGMAVAVALAVVLVGTCFAMVMGAYQ